MAGIDGRVDSQRENRGTERCVAGVSSRAGRRTLALPEYCFVCVTGAQTVPRNGRQNRREDEARAATPAPKTAERTLWKDVDSRNRGYFVDPSFLASASGRVVFGGFIHRFAAAALFFHALLLLPLPPDAVHSRGDCDLACGRRCCTRRPCA